MAKVSAPDLFRAAILTTLATFMLAGFLLMGGLGSGDDAEAQCARTWSSRCASPLTVTTSEIVSTGTSTSTLLSTVISVITTTIGPTAAPTIVTQTSTGIILTSITSEFTTTSTVTSVSIECSRGWFNRCLR